MIFLRKSDFGKSVYFFQIEKQWEIASGRPNSIRTIIKMFLLRGFCPMSRLPPSGTALTSHEFLLNASDDISHSGILHVRVIYSSGCSCCTVGSSMKTLRKPIYCSFCASKRSKLYRSRNVPSAQPMAFPYYYYSGVSLPALDKECCCKLQLQERNS